MKYRINWRSKITNNEGCGQYRFSKEEAEKLVNELNSEYPELNHWYELDMESIPESKQFN